MEHSNYKKTFARIRAAMGVFVKDPEGWMVTPNPNFDSRKPCDLIGTPDESKLWNLIAAAQQGIFS